MRSSASELSADFARGAMQSLHQLTPEALDWREVMRWLHQLTPEAFDWCAVMHWPHQRHRAAAPAAPAVG